MKVWDTEGNEHNREPVDVRELVEHLGWTTEAPKEPEKEAKK